ncbi:protein WHAT'S THIS FACTOR 1 homolog, chloroplastic isoform X2 [Cryptomeria japonica]|uniref:protein WHAT'S THIS FACTOR 1 homolog, chloroplastic isoform X2 n=1 Tax=Cryptomeria japonica TaxID=3369 RepID=UPI0027DAA36B|nr:protein WHAT'S THIS FACTOR 1 homolog, chloroplastic isoform X2 [Cryptomeria japonica]
MGGAAAQAMPCVLAFKPVFFSVRRRPPLRTPLSYDANAESDSISLSYSNSSFLGQAQPLQLHESGSTSFGTVFRYPTITAAIKRFNDKSLDGVIQNQKRLKLVTKLQQILLKQPDQKISLRELAKYRKSLGLEGRRRVMPILRKYPACFQIYKDETFSMCCRLTPQAYHLHLEELQIKIEIEHHLVQNLRKLLMMSASKRVLLGKIGYISVDMGLPMDFGSNLCRRYPQFLRVIETDHGRALELISWDLSLAVSAAEKKAEEQVTNAHRDLILDRPRKFRKIDLPRGYNLSRNNRDFILQFQEMPFISPYSDPNTFEPSSMEAEKHACAVVHELLSLTVEKKLLLDHLSLFKYDFKFSCKLRAMLLRHPELFYVSFKGHRDSVFLREAYMGSELLDKGPPLLVQEKFHALMLKGSRQAAKMLQFSNEVDGNGESSLDEKVRNFESDVEDESGYDQFEQGGNEWSHSQEEGNEGVPFPPVCTDLLGYSVMRDKSSS